MLDSSVRKNSLPSALAAPKTITRFHLKLLCLSITSSLTKCLTTSSSTSSKDSLFTPASIPPDWPWVGDQCQSKHLVPVMLSSHLGWNTFFLVSCIPIKSILFSFTISLRNLFLAGSARPLLFQIIPFIGNYLGFFLALCFGFHTNFV
uniref:Uncharacterized protein n=1 Tax=Arundo donax TaxID=35708 RepID=A0A0A9HBS8_ARUDO